MEINAITVDEAEVRGYIHLYRNKWLDPICPHAHSSICKANRTPMTGQDAGRPCDGRKFNCSSPDLAIIFTDGVDSES